MTKQKSKQKTPLAQSQLLPAVASPLESNTNNKVCRLKTDNAATKDYWIITNGGNVTLCKQKSGEEAQGSITIPIKNFNRLIRWYVKPQKLPKRNGR